MRTIENRDPTLPQFGASPSDRYDAGRTRRKEVPFETYAELIEGKKRADPLAILARQDESRVPELVPLRYGRMSRTPFTYLLGAAAVMAADLAAGLRTDLRVELCGDAHLGNFRWYHAPDRELVFDLNDFDETLPGPFEWDVKQLAASVTVAARNSGFPRKSCRAATRNAMCGYRESIAEDLRAEPTGLVLLLLRFPNSPRPH